jgi:hypothetical protein
MNEQAKILSDQEIARLGNEVVELKQRLETLERNASAMKETLLLWLELYKKCNVVGFLPAIAATNEALATDAGKEFVRKEQLDVWRRFFDCYKEQGGILDFERFKERETTLINKEQG